MGISSAYYYYAAVATAAAVAVDELTEKDKPGAAPQASAPQIQQADRETPEVRAAVDQQRKRLRAARGRQSTILTGGNELGEPRTSRRTILGG